MTEHPTYQELRDRLDKLDPKLRGWYEGFIDGLLYVQAQDPNVDDQPVRVTQPYLDRLNEKFDPQVFKDVLMDLDDEGGIVAHRMWVAPYEYTNGKGQKVTSDMPTLYLELVTTEGHRGVPEDWDDRPDMTPEEIRNALSRNDATS